MSPDHEMLRSEAMRIIRTTVKNGRIVVDEPTDLPDGHEVELAVLDDGMTADERRELHAALERGLEDAQAGRVAEMGAFLDRLDAEP